ncbi:protein-L-isoaspartate(D-aspartate) O-methyltransferase [Salinispirillum sp. LH 10-3-1]|uniref:Protein-L-isoaspartate O-methyltransferase n=1 Tax=Salinispirillum sp. LH 10-3-1 TaxID=2952525 RepID=A0AB38YIR4_9GAMM
MSTAPNALQLAGIGMTSARARQRMIDRLVSRGISDEAVLMVMAAVPRHIFVDEALSHRAYDDTTLPIGYGQTLSNSYTVARMTSLVKECSALESVLEIGSGSGYQTSVLAHLAKQVWSVERIAELQDRARSRCRLLSLSNVRFRVADGHWGWAEKGPYDAIVCTAAPDAVPSALLDQLSPEGGVLVIPVGDQQQQRLMRYRRYGDDIQSEDVEEAFFVPLVNTQVPL